MILMTCSYNDLKEMKESGRKLDWDTITKEQLERLFINDDVPNCEIASLYEVEPEKVRSKRRKWDIKLYSSRYYYIKLNQVGRMANHFNDASRERLVKEENVDWIAKAITHYIFRNGPVEDMHANNQLSQEDMKTLNKYMVNRLAGLLKLAMDGQWLKIELMLDVLREYGNNWEKAECDVEEIEYVFNNFCGYVEEKPSSNEVEV